MTFRTHQGTPPSLTRGAGKPSQRPNKAPRGAPRERQGSAKGSAKGAPRERQGSAKGAPRERQGSAKAYPLRDAPERPETSISRTALGSIIVKYKRVPPMVASIATGIRYTSDN